MLLVMASVACVWLAVRANNARDAADKAYLAEAAQRKEAESQKDRALRAETVAQSNERKVKEEAARATRAEQETRMVFEFFENHVLQAPKPKGPDGAQGKDVTILQAINAAEPKIFEEFKGQPAVEASIRNTLGLTYEAMGEPEKAIEQQRIALRLREATLGPDELSTNFSRNNLANAYRANGEPNEAIPLFLRALDGFRGMPDKDFRILACKNNLANAYKDTGQRDRAIALFHQVLNDYPKPYQPKDTFPLICKYNLGSAYLESGETNEALPLLREALQELTEAKDSEDHILICRGDLGRAYQAAGDPQRAIGLIREALEGLRRIRDPDSKEILIWERFLAIAYRDGGQYQEAERLFRDLLAKVEKGVNQNPVYAAGMLDGLGQTYLKQGNWKDAERSFRESRKIRDDLRLGDLNTPLTHFMLGLSLLGQDQRREAGPLLEDSYEKLAAKWSTIPKLSRPRIIEMLESVIVIYEKQGDKYKADRWRKWLEKTK